jgi:hypothetical protein
VYIYSRGSFGTKQKRKKKASEISILPKETSENSSKSRKIQTDMHEGLIEGRSMHAMIWQY